MLRSRLLSLALFITIFIAIILQAHAEENDSEMSGMNIMSGMYGPYSMTREASGTSWQPESTPMEGVHWMKKKWMLMVHGFIDGVYDHQGGPRGDSKFFSPNMFMFMAQRPIGAGTFGFRSMFSLDPATVGKSGYPLLLQTGETADGINPIIDRQHPHDFLMELAVTYSLPLNSESSLFAYFGLPGEPALGPPAFMHRLSGVEIPEAPITHHWLDATHVTFGVATVGAVWKNLKWEGSIFTGREPDQFRWNFDRPRFDSYSTRVSYNPTENWSFQTSYGFINSPEALEPNINVHRVTASASYQKNWEKSFSQTTFAWGLNSNHPGHNLNGFLLESLFHIHTHHNLIGRFETAQKDELFLDTDPMAGRKFTVNKLSLGYIYDILTCHHITWGLGGLGSVALLSESLHSTYGDAPLSFMLFTRIKIQ